MECACQDVTGMVKVVGIFTIYIYIYKYKYLYVYIYIYILYSYKQGHAQLFALWRGMLEADEAGIEALCYSSLRQVSGSCLAGSLWQSISPWLPPARSCWPPATSRAICRCCETGSSGALGVTAEFFYSTELG